MRAKPWSIFVGAVCIATTGCASERFDTAAEADAIITVEDETHDYTTARTYAMAQEVYDLSDLVEEPLPPTDMYDDLILTTVAEQMAEAGYTRVDLETGEPDVVVFTGKVAQRTWYLYGYWPCWGYPGYWCYYPPVTVPVAVDAGTVVVTMLDRDVTAPPPEGVTEPTVQPIWVGALNGLLESSIPNTERRIAEGLVQAFEQSPYLIVGPPVPPQPDPPGGM
jgi:hypothetical protein